MVRPRWSSARLLVLMAFVLAACASPGSSGGGVAPGMVATVPPPAYPPPTSSARTFDQATQEAATATAAAYPTPVPPSPTVAGSPTPTASGQPTPTDSAYEGEVDTYVIGLSQYPDTLFGIESQSIATTQVLAAVQPPCVTSLSYEYQPVCFTKLPSFADGDSFTRTVTVDASYPGPFVLNDELITDASELTQPLQLEQIVASWTLINGMAWEDGAPVTARDFTFAAELYAHPDVQNASRYLLERTASYEAPDDKTIVWTGVPGYRDATYFLNTFGPEPAHVLADMEPGAISASEYARRPLAYGPYKILEYVEQETVHLLANEHYWRLSERLPRVSRIVFVFLPNSAAILERLEGREIDAAGPISLGAANIPELEELERAGKIEVSYVPSTTWEHLSFAVRSPDGAPTPFSPVEARQAVAYAIDRQAIIDAALGGHGEPMRSFLPSEHWAYPPGGEGLEPYDYDPAKARELLAGLGYVPNAAGILEKDGKPFAVELATSDNNATRKLAAEQIQRDLRAVGIDVRITYLPTGQPEHLPRNWFETLPAELRMFAWVSGPDPSTALYRCAEIPWVENDWRGQNGTRWCDPEYDRLALAAEGEPDLAKRVPLLHAAQARWSAELPDLPLYQRLKIGAALPGLQGGMRLDPTSAIDFWSLEEWVWPR
ncbi:MAG TPA: peptide ABC transporter substrate-binding protein [Herpetosiphonaceae bacterium]